MLTAFVGPMAREGTWHVRCSAINFRAEGPVEKEQIAQFIDRMTYKNIDCQMIDAGDGRAGSIRVLECPRDPKQKTRYRMLINGNHPPSTQFVTISHELAHLFLGHLGSDPMLTIPERVSSESQKELEAESVAFLVAARNRVCSKSEAYLSNYAREYPTIDSVDVYQVIRAAGQVETLLGLTAQLSFDKPESRG